MSKENPTVKELFALNAAFRKARAADESIPPVTEILKAIDGQDDVIGAIKEKFGEDVDTKIQVVRDILVDKKGEAFADALWKKIVG